jgi:hypothetical protein
MIIILGLVILVAAVIAGLAGVLGNSGSGHALTNGFAVFGAVSDLPADPPLSANSAAYGTRP